MAPLSPPVRPPPEVLTALLEAATLPQLGGGRLRHALGSLEGPVPALEAMTRAVRKRLAPGQVERARGWARRAQETIERDAIHVLLPDDAAYPPALRAVHQPPCPLFARGRLELLRTPMVAVVGTRNSTSYGRDAAQRIAWGIAAAGVTVISGLARGIDGVAHRAAGPARTVAVVGCGIDVAFPREHTRLQEAIGREGLLLTEQLPGTPPIGHNYPRRNRIIAGLAEGVVVVEAPPRSGALITARHASQGNATVFAVPCPIGYPQSVGANELIRDGAHLVTSAREILLELDLPLPPDDVEAEIPPAELEGQGLALWRAVGREPRHIDEVAAAAGLDAHRSLASLLSLEVRGHVRQLSGMRFVRAEGGRTPVVPAGT
ncbi:MAG: DNA-processing protein DprA [Gemmatimonadota bacterium]